MYSIQVNWDTYKKAIKGSMINLTVITLLFQQVTYPLIVLSGVDFGPELPSLPTTIWHLFISIIVVEIGFYYSHRYIGIINYCIHAYLTYFRCSCTQNNMCYGIYLTCTSLNWNTLYTGVHSLPMSVNNMHILSAAVYSVYYSNCMR